MDEMSSEEMVHLVSEICPVCSGSGKWNQSKHK
jgi:hypothetical protein